MARAPTPSSTLVLREDPGLGEQLNPESAALALPSSVAAVLELPAGGWAPPEPSRPAGWLGLLVLDGLIARRVVVRGRTWTELLGQGDLLRPWQRERELSASYPPTIEFEVLSPARLALLNRRFLLRMAPWPEVTAAAAARLVDRAQSLAYTLATCGRVGVAERVLLTLHHLADRWGRVTSEGTVVDLPGVTHEVLASQVGAARPSVSSAVTELRLSGAIERLPSGAWLLYPDKGRGSVDKAA